MVPSPYILIVEDEPGIQILLPRLIARLSPSAAVHTVSTNAEALQSIDQRLPDVLIIDLRIPRSDGLTVIRMLRARQATCPILAMAGSIAQRDAAAAAGSTPVLLQPFAREELRQTLAELGLSR